ncbi:MAG: hypothetical protein ACODAF_10375 [Actinomycetota bacterium]
MRRFVRVFVLVTGLLLTLAGAAGAVLVGPDDTVSGGERELATDTAALATGPSVLDFMGPTVHVAAALQSGDVFVGVGHEVDVRDYLGGVAHEEIVRVGLPWSPQLEPREGEEDAAAVEPGTRDWWYVQASGPGRQQIAYELGPEPVSVVVMSADGTAPVTADVDVGLQFDNLFGTFLLVAGGGVVLLLAGVFVLRPRRRRGEGAPEPERDSDVQPAEERSL